MKSKNYLSYLIIFLISLTAQIPLTSMRYVVPYLAHSYGASIFIIGLLGTIYGLIYFILASIFGKLSDKFGIKKMASIGMILYILVIISYKFYDRPYEFLIGRAFEAVSMSMVWPAVESLSSKLGGKSKEEALLMYTFGWSVGASIAPYAVAYLLSYNYIYPLIFSSIISLISALLIISSKQGIEIEINKYEGNFSILFNIFLPMLLYGFDSSIFYSFYSVYGPVFGFNKEDTGLLGTLYGILQTLAFILSWLFAKKISSNKLIIGGTIMSVPLFILYFDHSYIFNSILFSILGLGMGFVYYATLINIFRTFHRDLTSKTGIFESSIGIGYVIGPLIAGIPTKLGYIFPWIILAIFSFIILIIEVYGYIEGKTI
ncbi:arabinose efflux permease family protein [Caldisphaera lagunensis DSM 15908]|uniref:Arabinose efflux permease family protein n=1 Tax=Caldisphaera lagunensis (strain DSM 15908 / JCM 11604 / ANMR 0165 / IC-154) TaxID=1056495 RepID=L0A7Q7_CALLD|nr:MFS transporter [Caldisphaera lagunensis]AFZ69903.1 arabinose efflux permease family protein [Caldisphaera lagunensis DSM 15908]